MVLGPRIVFLIDRYQGDDEHNSRKVANNINLCCLRILSFYKHSLCVKGTKPSILWGYKFFTSIKHQTSNRYKQGEFLEYSTNNFDKFENELIDGVCYDVPEKNVLPGEKIKMALTDLITEFQWDRPELFSPGKIWKSGNNHNANNNNMIFLFTNCPSSFDTFFNNSYEDDKAFIQCMFPDVLYTKFVKHCKLRLCWVDTGNCMHKKSRDKNHVILDNAMKSIHGLYLEMKYLSSLWVFSAKNEEFIHKDVVNVCSLMKLCLDSNNDDNINIKNYKFSYEGIQESSLSLCNVYPCIETGRDVGIKSIDVIDVIDLKSVRLCSLDCNSSYYFTINPKTICQNKDLLVHFNDFFVSEKCFRIKLTLPGFNEAHDAVMILSTYFFGYVIPLLDEINTNDIPIDAEVDVFDDITEELKCQFYKNLFASKRDFSTSLVNSVDAWFLTNPCLGCTPVVKTVLSNICCDDISLRKKRDGNSKFLVEHMKGVNSKLNIFDNLNSSGRSRLKKYRKRLIEEKENLNNSNINENSLNESNYDQVFNDKVELPTEEKLKEIILSEYELLNEKSLSLSIVRNIFKIVIQFYKSNESEAYKESSFSLLNSTIFNNVDDIRDKNIDTPKEDLVKEYLIQVHLYLECIHHFSPPNTDPILTKIVSFLRTVSFEKSAAFISKHLNEVVLPRYPDMRVFLQEIYENLMLEFPDDLEESKEMEIDDDSSVKSAESSLKSYCSSEYSPSIQSIQAEKRTFRRKSSSVVGDMKNSKKLIAVQIKKPVTKEKVDKKKSDEKVVKRTLFSQEPPPQSKILTTPKANRRRSEPAAKQKVPDTPETSQKNDMMWKKLERKRRYSNIDNKMVTIDESPVKEIASPIKRHSSFYRSSSFNCHTSPRRFYKKLQRHPSMNLGNHRTFQEPQEIVKSDKIVSASPLEVKLRRRSTLFSNFDEDDNFADDNQIVPITHDENEYTKLASHKSIVEVTPKKHRSNSGDTDSQVSKRLKLSPGIEPIINTPDKKRSKNKKVTRFTFDNIEDEKPVFMSETTVDWLTEMEKDQSNTPTNFTDAFAKLSNTPVVIQSPAIIKAGNESISVSPCLSASSIEVLENAPIISPIVTKRKRRRGRLLHDEYE